ncbi:MAG: VWA domain-containing protein [Betaproteobacteria bacterium]|nr:VWA domain-containing protein [Betaproteobacteria bacterium]
MRFIWTEALWLLLLVPALVGLYLWLLRRKKKAALKYASLGIIREAMGPGTLWRRHLPPALFLLALTAMILAIARPSATITLPAARQTIILTMDVSGSMRAKDIEPSRFEAMQAAARKFINEAPRNTKIGIISFAGTASVVQAPTENKEDLLASIERFQLQRATAIGSGIIVSLATLLPDAGIEIASLMYGDNASRVRSLREPAKKEEKKEFKPVPPGSNSAGAIILLSDGQRTTGPDSIEAAKMAADRGVRVFTVGLGTVNGEVVGFEGWSFRVRLDEETLKQVANLTRGEYFYAGSATDLNKVYETLNTRLILETKETEVSALVSAFAALLALVAGVLSLVWFNRIL